MRRGTSVGNDISRNGRFPIPVPANPPMGRLSPPPCWRPLRRSAGSRPESQKKALAAYPDVALFDFCRAFVLGEDRSRRLLHQLLEGPCIAVLDEALPDHRL